MDTENDANVKATFLRHNYFNFFYLQEEHAVCPTRLQKDEKLETIKIRIKKIHADLNYAKDIEKVTIKTTNYANALIVL